MNDLRLACLCGWLVAPTLACGDDGGAVDPSVGANEAGASHGMSIGSTSGAESSTGDGPSSATAPSPPQEERFVVARFDGGSESWSVVGPVEQVPSVAAVDPNGDVIVALQPFGELHDSRIVRVSEGALVDEVTLQPQTRITSLAVDAQGTLFVAGLFEERTGYQAFDGAFAEHWPLTTTGSSPDARAALGLGPELSIVYAGWSDALAAPVLSRIDGDGAVAWETPLPGVSEVPEGAGISGVAVDPDGAVALALTSGGEDSMKLWVDGFGPDGAPAWAFERESTGAGGITVDAAGRFIVSGYELIFADGIQEHLWLGAFDATGAQLWESLSEQIALGPIHSCGDGFIVTRDEGMRATVFGPEGEPGATVEYEAEGSLRGTAAFCTPDGGIVLVGVSTVLE